MTQKSFVPVEEVRKLSHGSYEHVIAKIQTAVNESTAALFGEQIGARICGTFPGSAIVMSESGAVVRAFWEQAEDGSVKIVRHEDMKVPSFTEATVGDYVEGQVAKAVRAWEAGRVEEAQTIISEIAPYVRDRPVLDDDKVVDMLNLEFAGPRPWRKIYEAQTARIHKTVGERKMKDLAVEKGEKKFALLYGGTLNEQAQAGYRDLVKADLSYLTTRVESLRDLVEASYSGLGSVVRSEDLKGKAAIKTFVVFTEDLISDLRRLHKVLSEAGNTLAKIDSLGKLYDVVAEGLYDREVAAHFVDTMATRLQETPQ